LYSKATKTIPHRKEKVNQNQAKKQMDFLPALEMIRRGSQKNKIKEA
jgi:hypothetical protein